MLRPVVVGSFRASGGSGNDIAAVLAAESEFENWINGHQARALFATDKVTMGQLNVLITQSGSYILAFNVASTPLTPCGRTGTPKWNTNQTNRRVVLFRQDRERNPGVALQQGLSAGVGDGQAMSRVRSVKVARNGQKK
jgi:hypothetical protein